MCFDSDTKHIIGTQMSRDADLSADDRIDILIDSFRDQVESWRVFAAPINYELNSGEDIVFNYAKQFEPLFEPFEIAQGVTLPAGDYRFTRWGLEIDTASKRRWQFSMPGRSARSGRATRISLRRAFNTKWRRIFKQASRSNRPLPA